MTEFANKTFSVYPGKDGGQAYRDNWDRIYKKTEVSHPCEDSASLCAGNQVGIGHTYDENECCYKCGESKKLGFPKEPELCVIHHLPLLQNQCPYSSEINNEVKDCDCCDECYQECLNDI